MKPLLLVLTAMAMPVADSSVYLINDRALPCAVFVLRDYDFYFYYYSQLRLTPACGETGVLQVRKVSTTNVRGTTRPLNVWPPSGVWIVSRHGNTVPSRFQLTTWNERWEYRLNERSPWTASVVR